MKPLTISPLLALLTVPAFAGTSAPAIDNTHFAPPAVSEWSVRAALYGWGTALDGDVTLRGNNVPVDSGFDDILDNLDFAMMGAVEIGNGKWSLLADLFYAELSSSSSRGNLDFKSQLDQFIGNFVITYNVMDDPGTRLDVYAGARVNSLDADLDILTNNVGTFSGSDSKTWVDPLIGVRFQQELPNCFFMRGVGDIGGFGVSSDFTWQALAGLGYHLSESNSVLLGYRGVGTDYEDGAFGYDVISHGVLLGFECKF